jgi:hypothetical protein
MCEQVLQGHRGLATLPIRITAATPVLNHHNCIALQTKKHESFVKARCIKVHQGASRCIKVHQGASRCIKVHQGASTQPGKLLG